MRAGIRREALQGTSRARPGQPSGRFAAPATIPSARAGSLRLALALGLSLAVVLLALALFRRGGGAPGSPGEPPASSGPTTSGGLPAPPQLARPVASPQVGRSSAGKPADMAVTEAARAVPLEGTVRDEQGAPIGPPAPRLRLRAPDGSILAAPVDAHGRWRLEALAVGTWELTASADEHVPQTLRLELGAEGARGGIHMALRRAERLVVRLETPGGPADPDELQDELQALAPFLEVRLGESRAVPAPAPLPSSPQVERLGLLVALERGAGASVAVEVLLGDLLVASSPAPQGSPRELVIALDPTELRRRLIPVRLRLREVAGGEPLRPASAFLRAADARWVLEAVVEDPGTCSLPAVPPGPAVLVLTLPDGSTRRATLVVPAEGPADLDVVPGA